MPLITQNSRILHHRLTSSGTTFTVPVQEDFTSQISPWTITDLGIAEFGMNIPDNKLYVRIGDNINEVLLNESGSTISGSSNQVAYFDSTGLITSDSGFTHSLTGGTLSYVQPESDIQYGLLNGNVDFLVENYFGTGNTGSALYYNDESNGKDWLNLVGVIDNIQMGETDFNNASYLLWTDNSGTEAEAIVIATQVSSGTPLVSIQAQILDEYSNLGASMLNVTPQVIQLGYYTGSTGQTFIEGIEIAKGSISIGNYTGYGEDNTFVNGLQIDSYGNSSFTGAILSGSTDLNSIFVQKAVGLTGSYPVGSNTLTLVNGLITGIA